MHRGGPSITAIVDGGKLCFGITATNLDKPVAAHIHMGKPGVAGPVILALCGPCTSGMTGNTATTTAVGDALEHGKAYVNVHTAKNAGGEIRGAAKLTTHT